ncbi:DUF1295-containing protein [Aureococcus anophagefferens]|nr:DUF1295-containing protein [Aureococcus anophagefferens]
MGSESSNMLRDESTSEMLDAAAAALRGFSAPSTAAHGGPARHGAPARELRSRDGLYQRTGEAPERRVSAAACRAAYATALAAATVLAAAAPWPDGWADAPLVRGLALDAAATVVVYGFSLRADNSSVYDPYWCVLPLWLLFYWKAEAPGGFWFYEPRETMVLCCVWAWAWRFFLFVPWEGWTVGLATEDWRYQDLRAKLGRGYWGFSLASLHLTPTLLVYGALAPAARVVLAGSDAPPLNRLDAVALACVVAAAAAAAKLRRRGARRGERGVGPAGTGAAAYEELLATPPELLGALACWATARRAATGLEFVSADDVPPTLGHGRRSLPQEHQLLPSGAAGAGGAAARRRRRRRAALSSKAALAPVAAVAEPAAQGSAQLKSCLSSSKKRRPRTAARPAASRSTPKSRVTTFRRRPPALTPGGTERTREADGRRASDPGGAAAAADAGAARTGARRRELGGAAVDDRPRRLAAAGPVVVAAARVGPLLARRGRLDVLDERRRRRRRPNGPWSSRALTADRRGAQLSPIGEEGEAQSPESAPSTAAPKFGANFESPDGGDDVAAPDADRTVALEAHLGELLDLSPGAPPADATVQLEASLGELLEASGARARGPRAPLPWSTIRRAARSSRP